jgi:hypothetical protein
MIESPERAMYAVDAAVAVVVVVVPVGAQFLFSVKLSLVFPESV